MCAIRVKGKFQNISIFNAHALTEDPSEQEKVELYSKLKSTLNKIPRYDMIIIACDFNSKIGKESIYQPTIGTHNKHEVSNENGVKLMIFAISRHMIIRRNSLTKTYT